MTRRVSRREVLAAGAALGCGACATVPEQGDRFELAQAAQARACDHDLCRCWRATGGGAAEAAPGEPRWGRCGLGVPEGL